MKNNLETKDEEEIEVNIELSENSEDKSSKKTDEKKEVASIGNKEEIELKDDINNARKKRRRSSATIE